MDDKWLFTRNYFEESAIQNGYSKIIICPLDKNRICLRSF